MTADYSRISLGTVQFGLDYGVSNSDGRPDISAVDQILAEARSVGIKTIDTAPTYGDAEVTLGILGVADFDIVTKVPKVPIDEPDVESFINRSIDQSLNRLKVNELMGLLIHDDEILRHPSLNAIINCLLKHKTSGIVRNIGISVYRPEQIRDQDLLHAFDIIQAPVNIVDRRFLNVDLLNCLTHSDVRIHARSVFLQGLLLMEVDSIPRYFDGHMHLLKEWTSLLKLHNDDPMSVCLSFVSQRLELEQVVLGVQSIKQLKQVIASYSKIVDTDRYDSIISVDDDLVNPTNWTMR